MCPSEPKNIGFEKYIVENRLRVIVRSNAPKTEIVGWDASRQELRVNIKAPPEKNKANKEIIRFFSKLTKKKAYIMAGARSKKKVLIFE